MTVKSFAIVILGALPLLAQNAPLHPRVGEVTTNYTQIVPLVIVGEGWSQRIILTNVDDSLADVGTVQFFTQSGRPWTVNLTNGGNGSVFAFSLQPGQTVIFETVVQQNPQTLGWALIQETTSGIGNIFGQTVFRKQTPGLPDFMCSMALGNQALKRLTVFFDNTGGRYTGMGILTTSIFGVCLSSCNTAYPLRVTVQDLSGRIISQKIISEPEGVLYWMNLGADFPETNGIQGNFVVEQVTQPSQPSPTLTGFSLQFAPNGAFTVVTPFEN